MKKVFLILLVIVLATKLTKAQTDCKSYKVDDKISIKLPMEPVRKDINDMTVLTKDSSAFFVTILDAGVDSAKTSEIINKPGFADALKKAIVDKMPGFTVGEMTRSSWKSYTVFRAEGIDSSKNLKLYFCMLSIGIRLYFMGNVVPEKSSNHTDLINLLSLN
jgi:hypothetical protein